MESLFVNSPVGTPVAVTITSTEIDLRTVTGASLQVERKDKTTASWACTLGTPTEGAIQLTHVIQAGDLTVAGDYYLFALLELAGGGSRRSEVMHLHVSRAYEFRP